MTTTVLINPVLLRHAHIKLAVLFGSLAAGTARPDSDLDLAVADDKPLRQVATRAGRRRWALLLRKYRYCPLIST